MAADHRDAALADRSAFAQQPFALHTRRKILVIGSGGAGKSTFARELGEITGLPVIHLDRHFWKPGWQETPRDEWRRVVTELASAPAWIMDGNFGGSLALRLAHCDAVVFFDFPRLVCLWGVVRRRLRYRQTSRPDMTDGCNERLDADFLWWIWRYPSRSRPSALRAITETGAAARTVRVTNRAAVESLLDAARQSLQSASARS